MGTHAHAVEFVTFMREMAFAGRYASREVLEFYAWWTYENFIFPLKPEPFLMALSAHPAVQKKRERVKDPVTGRVAKLASGTPARTYFYEIGDTPLPGPVRPRKPSAKTAAEQPAPRRAHEPLRRAA